MKCNVRANVLVYHRYANLINPKLFDSFSPRGLYMEGDVEMEVDPSNKLELGLAIHVAVAQVVFPGLSGKGGFLRGATDEYGYDVFAGENNVGCIVAL